MGVGECERVEMLAALRGPAEVRRGENADRCARGRRETAGGPMPVRRIRCIYGWTMRSRPWRDCWRSHPIPTDAVERLLDDAFEAVSRLMEIPSNPY